MRNLLSAALVLEDGSRYEGYSFGARVSSSAELVFNTAMSGYPEIVTNPVYAGQIVMLTYPLVGNYGMPSEKCVSNGISCFFESDRIHLKGLVVSGYSFEYSHWNASESLAERLQRENIPAIFGVDTREITKKIREKGTMLAKIVVNGTDDPGFEDFRNANLVSKVSVSEPKSLGEGDMHVVVIDCGVQNNLVRCLLKRGVRVTLVPWNTDVSGMEYDGLMISDGPGDPSLLGAVVENISKAMESLRPIFGVGLGNELMAMAAGASVYRMKYGHHGHNQPAHELGTMTTVITAQDHIYAVDTANLSSDWKVLYENLNDGTPEGFAHKTRPFFSVQFHPDETSVKSDSEFAFDRFVKLIKEHLAK